MADPKAKPTMKQINKMVDRHNKNKGYSSKKITERMDKNFTRRIKKLKIQAKKNKSAKPTLKEIEAMEKAHTKLMKVQAEREKIKKSKKKGSEKKKADKKKK